MRRVLAFLAAAICLAGCAPRRPESAPSAFAADVEPEVLGEVRRLGSSWVAKDRAAGAPVKFSSGASRARPTSSASRSAASRARGSVHRRRISTGFSGCSSPAVSRGLSSGSSPHSVCEGCRTRSRRTSSSPSPDSRTAMSACHRSRAGTRTAGYSTFTRYTTSLSVSWTRRRSRRHARASSRKEKAGRFSSRAISTSRAATFSTARSSCRSWRPKGRSLTSPSDSRECSASPPASIARGSVSPSRRSRAARRRRRALP